MLTVKEYLEIIYYISGIVVAITAVLALYHIKIAKNALNIQSKRDSLSLTASQCQDYNERIISLQNQLSRKIDKLSSTFFKLSNWSVDTNGNDISVMCRHDEYPDLDELENYIPELLAVINAMDTFALYFTSKVADERVAYSTVGNTFIFTAELYMPWIILMYKDQGYHSHLVNLYIIWKNRVNHEKLLFEKSQIENKLSTTIQSSNKPIGT